MSFKDGLKPVCQIRRVEHKVCVINCPRLDSIMKQCAVRREQLFPSLSDKDCKRKGAKPEAQDEYRENFCPVWERMKLPDSAVQNHNSTSKNSWHVRRTAEVHSEFEELPKFIKDLEAEDDDGPVSLAQYRKDNGWVQKVLKLVRVRIRHQFSISITIFRHLDHDSIRVVHICR